ncbi:MAG: hypothetical protein M0Z44_09515 [Gammaproteobacteria bacterium]|nr:hypothetical protein [Gammaproteobacteria bacterium]
MTIAWTQSQKTWRVDLSHAAERALAARTVPLTVELELFFSCLIRKRVRIEAPSSAAALLLPEAHPKLVVWFHPVMAQHCALPENARLEELPLTTFPLNKTQAFTPRWLSLDYGHGVWTGDFGWDRSSQ